MTVQTKPNELRIIRVYDAPVEAVWDAWTDLEQVRQWWGPRGFTLTSHAKDLRVGGVWHYTMHGPDGVDYPNKTFYHEVVKNSKLVYDHGGYDDRPPLFRVTALFIDLGDGKTKLDMTMALATAEAANETRKFIKKAGGNATWDRLAEYLMKKTSGKDAFVINRTFDAPVDTIFEMWTNPKHVAKWLPPTGFTMEFLKADIRSGGSMSYKMSNGGMTMYGRADYLDIRRPDRLVYTQQFCDDKGNVSRHPMAPTWPETMLTTVQFVEEDAGKTRVTVTWEAHGKVTPAELATFLKERGGMTQGWTGSFDKLDALLQESPAVSRA